MQTSSVTLERIASSVIAVPPMARNSDLTLNEKYNSAIVKHIEKGGVEILLYGGNANFYHIPVSEYAETLRMLISISGENTLVIPSVGPAYGTMIDQASILNDFDFPTVMALPQREIATSTGIATGIRQLSESISRPIVLYLKHDNYMDVKEVASLVDDGLISFIKYAVVRDDANNDAYLQSIVDKVDGKMIVSGIGEQPAIIHRTQFGLAGFTSGCVCVAPKLSMNMLTAIHEGDLDEADKIRQQFQPLEDLRNEINPIRVLHHAIDLAGIAPTGPILPLLSPIVDDAKLSKITSAAKQLLRLNG